MQIKSKIEVDIKLKQDALSTITANELQESFQTVLNNISEKNIKRVAEFAKTENANDKLNKILNLVDNPPPLLKPILSNI